MDKNTFETYEFVIQDDDTLLLNRQVQFVTEVQEGTEAMDSSQCAVYDVNPQQFFVDMGNNHTELISVADNYILPAPVSGEVNSIYSNSFLLQTVGTDISAQAEKDLTITVQFKEAEQNKDTDDVVNVINKQGNTCTEITLSDEQYTSLEQKGWVLIESNGKIFILDAFGLHEVTTNHNLIKNLKDETNIDLPVEADSTGITEDSHTDPLEHIIIQNSQLEQDIVPPIEYEDSYCEKETDKEIKLDVIDEEAQIIKQEKKLDLHESPTTLNNVLEEKKRAPAIHPEPQKYKNSKIKILTKYSFKDIPDKILLGRTPNGKKLIAKVVKRTFSDTNIVNNDEGKPQGSIKITTETINSSQTKDSPKGTDIDDAEWESLVRRAVDGELTCNSEELVDASDVITQLFQLPEFGASVAGRNVVITRVTEKPSSLFASNRTINFVSGFVKSAENRGLLFIHVPNLLQKLTKEYQDYFNSPSGRSVLKGTSENAPDCKILQVHIAETKHNGVQAISFILNERYLPCKFSDHNISSRKVSKLHACGFCADIFQSEAQLAEHQESHTMESDGALTIDTDKLPKDVQSYTIMENRYYIVKTNKGSEYCCFQCTKRFNKLSNCIRHIRTTHNRQKSDKTSESANQHASDRDDGDKDYVIKSVDPPEAPYKCKMCPCAYYYPASLSKHISKTHIMDKLNTTIPT